MFYLAAKAIATESLHKFVKMMFGVLAFAIAAFTAAVLVFLIKTRDSVTVSKPKPVRVVKMEQALAKVQPGDIVETQGGYLTLVYKSRGAVAFTCYRPTTKFDDAQVELGPCWIDRYATFTKRIYRKDRDPRYATVAIRFIGQMTPRS